MRSTICTLNFSLRSVSKDKIVTVLIKELGGTKLITNHLRQWKGPVLLSRLAERFNWRSHYLDSEKCIFMLVIWTQSKRPKFFLYVSKMILMTTLVWRNHYKMIRPILMLGKKRLLSNCCSRTFLKSLTVFSFKTIKM